VRSLKCQVSCFWFRNCQLKGGLGLDLTLKVWYIVKLKVGLGSLATEYCQDCANPHGSSAIVHPLLPCGFEAYI